jgi:hypothetical protein
LRNKKVNIVQKAANMAKKPPKNSPPRIHRKMWKKSEKISPHLCKNFILGVKKLQRILKKLQTDI